RRARALAGRAGAGLGGRGDRRGAPGGRLDLGCNRITTAETAARRPNDPSAPFVPTGVAEGGQIVVTRLTSPARPLIAALAILALGAGSALAAAANPAAHQMPAAAAPGLGRAAEAAGKTVPVAAPAA